MYGAVMEKERKNVTSAVRSTGRLAERGNRTGIPTQLKERMERSTGYYNSALSARLDALAYTQGNQVEIAPGQERQADAIGAGKKLALVQRMRNNVVQRMGNQTGGSMAVQQAQSSQGSGNYPGVDNWQPKTYNVGDVLYRGEPNGTNFFTTRDAINYIEGAEARCLANPQYGAGGLVQEFVPEANQLINQNDLVHVDTISLT